MNPLPVEKSHSPPVPRPPLRFTLGVLLAINTLNFFDRQVLGAVAEPLKQDWQLSDRQLGALGTAFTLLYAVVGVPFGIWADVGRRTRILAGGVALWSLLTAVSGLAWSFWSLFVFRLGVGVGEASCAPAANSLLGDLVPPQRRARVLSVFMLGLPLGLGLSFLISGAIAERWGWRAALLVAGLPGLLLAVVTLWVAEPVRGAAELRPIGAARRSDPLTVLLRIPTFWWIIASGALHNFNMYALFAFLSPFLMRYHGLNAAQAGRVGALISFCGGLGLLFGGWACDRLARRRVSGRLEAATLALLAFVPSLLLALQWPPGDPKSDWNAWGCAACLLPGCMLSYVYYAGVYATLQDIVEPALRGTAMAVYFCAMYLFGASLGPVLTGWASDYFKKRAATAAAEAGLTINAGAVGLHHAMYLLPALGVALVVVLFIASRTVKADHARLQQWIKSVDAA